MRIISNVSHYHVTLKFLGNRLTDEGQFFYAYFLETSEKNELQRHFLEGAQKP